MATIKICKFCGKEYFKKSSFGLNQYRVSKYCSRQCSANDKKIYTKTEDRQVAYRRRKGMSPRNSKEYLEKASYLTKLAMQRPEVKAKIRQPRQPLSLKHRLKISNKLTGIMPKNLNYNSCAYPNIQRGYYDINGTTMYFRSKWEANYALFLDFLVDHGEIAKWEFEPDTFVFEKIKFGTRSYTPDFKVFKDDNKFEYHEVKGYMDSKSKTKLKRMKKYYPEIVVKLVDTSEYNLLKKQIGKLCKFY